MTDKELLELAAKAAGQLTPNWYGNDAYFDGVLSRWNPLTNDGDALRLAVKLGLIVELHNFRTRIELPSENYLMDCEPHGDNPYAATRRAIVRAAAEIGKAMQ